MSYTYTLLGTSASPAFNGPQKVALDLQRNTYVADTGNNLLRKISVTDGSVTSLGPATTGGLPTWLNINRITVDGLSTIYGDAETAGSQDCIRSIKSDNTNLLTYTNPILSCVGLAVNAGGTSLFVSSAGTTIDKYSISVGVLTLTNTWTTTGFNSNSIAIDAAENVYICDLTNGQIKKLNTSTGSITSFGPSAGYFSQPLGVGLDIAGNVYVADYNNKRICKITSDGSTTTVLNTNYSFQGPYSVALDTDGNVYVSDNVLNTIVKLTLQQPVVCFNEDTKILTDSGYKLVQDLRKGDLIKTLLNGFVPIEMIAKKEFFNPASSERIKDQLYILTNENYPEIFEPLVITGCHSILVDGFKDDEERQKTNEVLGNVYITNQKYRLPACVDERCEIYDKKGNCTIYHIALENENYYGNYGIYANGLLVETCSRRYLKELSNMNEVV
jgi:hypothetical protein